MEKKKYRLIGKTLLHPSRDASSSLAISFSLIFCETRKEIAMYIRDLEKIAKVVEKFGIEFYNEHKDEIDAIGKEVEKLEKDGTASNMNTKVVRPDDLITQSRTIYDVELVDYKLSVDAGRLYMSLRYKVATDVGDVDMLFPKIRIPFVVDHLPKLKVTDDGRLLLCAGDCTFYPCEAKHPDYPSLDKAYVFEHMGKPPQREMTVAEIEKELGYKVKVVGGPYDKREK